MRLGKTFLFTFALGLAAGTAACTNSDESGKSTPQTVFDETVPDPRSDDQKVIDFILSVEKKYKRDETRNAVDLHFTSSAPRRIRVRLTYDRQADPTKVSSIADAAIELVKRLKREDPSVRGLEIGIDREVVRRED